MPLVHGTHAEEGVGHGNLGLLGEAPQVIGGVGDEDAVPGQDDRSPGRRDLAGGDGDLAGVTVEARLEAGQVERLGMAGLRLARQGVLGEVDVDRTRASGAGDMERLGDDARDVVGLAHQVVVLRHGQRDAADVDLLEGVLADERAGHVAGDGDHGHGVQLGGGDARDQVRGAGTARPQADADPAAGPGVAVGSVGSALLVAHEDRAQLGIVGPDVVEGQDDAARVAEDDIDALADERLAQGVGADARAVQGLAPVEHVAARLLDGLCLGRAEGWHVAASPARRLCPGAGRRPRRLDVGGSMVATPAPADVAAVPSAAWSAGGSRAVRAPRSGSPSSSLPFPVLRVLCSCPAGSCVLPCRVLSPVAAGS